MVKKLVLNVVLNEFFSNIVTNLNFLQFNKIDPTFEKINDHSKLLRSIAPIRVLVFNFSVVEKGDILKETKTLRLNKS